MKNIRIKRFNIFYRLYKIFIPKPAYLSYLGYIV
jgi:hypothetical protein